MKQAYLIMAHTNLNQLCRLVSVLDHENNDIFIHADLKWVDFNVDVVQDYCKKSNLFFVKRLDVVWGAYSQIECEMNLFTKAVETSDYVYLHLISGFDFPLRPIEQINKFFEENYPAQFVYFDRKNNSELALQRCREYHIFQKYAGRKKNAPSLIKKIEDLSLGIQRKIGINRHRKKCFSQFGKGANWVSITGEFANYLIRKNKEIEKSFCYSVCCDEVFLHTVLKSSPYYVDVFKADYRDKNNHLYTNMVYTDWERGRPYTFRTEDYEELISSPYLFARKFDEEIDCGILDCLEAFIRKERK